MARFRDTLFGVAEQDERSQMSRKGQHLRQAGIDNDHTRKVGTADLHTVRNLKHKKRSRRSQTRLTCITLAAEPVSWRGHVELHSVASSTTNMRSALSSLAVLAAQMATARSSPSSCPEVLSCSPEVASQDISPCCVPRPAGLFVFRQRFEPDTGGDMGRWGIDGVDVLE